MTSHPWSLLRAFGLDRRGSAGIELALGSVALLAIAVACFDLHALVRVKSGSARSAVVMADYVSREAAPDGDQMAALGKFLGQTEFHAPSDLVYVVTAVKRPPGTDPAEVLWVDDAIRLGDPTAIEGLASRCTQRGASGWRTRLLGAPGASGMREGEVAIVAEVCARPSQVGLLSSRLVAGDLYGLHILPVRDPEQVPSSPVRSAPEETASSPPSSGGTGSAGGRSSG